MSAPAQSLALDLCIPSDLAEARRVQCEIEHALQQSQFCEHDIFAIKLAIEEALVNAIKHGNQFDPEKKVRVGYSATSERFEIVIEDEGPASAGRPAPFRRVWLHEVAPAGQPMNPRHIRAELVLPNELASS